MQAVEDAERSQVSEAGMVRIRELNAQEEATTVNKNNSVAKDNTARVTEHIV